jgi:hypothetical protein
VNLHSWNKFDHSNLLSRDVEIEMIMKRGGDSRHRAAIRTFFRHISRFADVAGSCAVALLVLVDPMAHGETKPQQAPFVFYGSILCTSSLYVAASKANFP